MESSAFFITLEGGEGAGKSTHASFLQELLQEWKIPVLLTREPGGSVKAEKIRELLLKPSSEKWDVLTEYLLFSAARRDHLVKTIIPALKSGHWVICDRFYDSSLAYQGAGGGLDPRFMDLIYDEISEGLQPDLTFVFDVPPHIRQERLKKRLQPKDNFELKNEDFHAKVRGSFLKQAERNPERYVVIPADQSKERVREHIKKIMHQRFHRFFPAHVSAV